MDTANFPPEVQKALANASPEVLKRIAESPFPYNRLDLMWKYRGKTVVVVDEEIVAAGDDVDLRSVFKHYRSLGKEPILTYNPAY